MFFTRSDLLLYAITDERWLGDKKLEDVVREIIKSGVTCIQLRDKEASDKELEEKALKLLPVCRFFNVPLIINDNVKVAKAVDADGVHLGQDDMALPVARVLLGNDFIIGVSCHSVDEAVKAQSEGADYVGVGAVFGSKTKTNTSAMTPELLKKITSAVNIPVVAIGGINKNNLNELEGSGIAGTAVISAIFADPDPAQAAKNLCLESEKLFGDVSP